MAKSAESSEENFYSTRLHAVISSHPAPSEGGTNLEAALGEIITLKSATISRAQLQHALATAGVSDQLDLIVGRYHEAVTHEGLNAKEKKSAKDPYLAV